MIDKECLICDFYDPDYECACSPLNRWYACPLEAEPKLEYTGEDIVEVYGDNGNRCYDIKFADGMKYSIPYSILSDDEFEFLRTKAYESEMLNMFAEYVNSGKGITRESKNESCINNS